MRRDLAAVADAARAPHCDSVLELAVDLRRVGQFDTPAHRVLARLERTAQLAAHPRLAQLQDFAIRRDTAECLHGQRPVSRLCYPMDPAVVVVGYHHERLEGVELGAL